MLVLMSYFISKCIIHNRMNKFNKIVLNNYNNFLTNPIKTTVQLVLALYLYFLLFKKNVNSNNDVLILRT